MWTFLTNYDVKGQWEQGCSLFMATDLVQLGPHVEKKQKNYEVTKVERKTAEC